MVEKNEELQTETYAWDHFGRGELAAGTPRQRFAVPGGWLYQPRGGGGAAPVFVPGDRGRYTVVARWSAHEPRPGGCFVRREKEACAGSFPTPHDAFAGLERAFGGGQDLSLVAAEMKDGDSKAVYLLGFLPAGEHGEGRWAWVLRGAEGFK